MDEQTRNVLEYHRPLSVRVFPKTKHVIFRFFSQKDKKVISF